MCVCVLDFLQWMLFYFESRIMQYTLHICFVGEVLLAWYSQFYKSMGSMIINLIKIVPVLRKKYGETCKMLFSHLERITFEELQKSLKDGPSIIIGYRV